MGKLRGFLEHQRLNENNIQVKERVKILKNSQLL